MRTAGWRWVLIPMVVVVAGCLPHPPPDLPASFLSAFSGATFSVQPPPSGQTGQDIVAALAADPGAHYPGRAIPVFGVIDCHGLPDCSPGPGGARGAAARTVWLVVYPDCVDPDGNAGGWTIVDALKGLDPGYRTSGKCL